MAIRRATSDDLRRLCVTAVTAFADDPVMRWLIPDDDDFFAPGGEIMRPAVAAWLEHQVVWCTDDAVALGAWIRPGRPDPEFEVDPPPAPTPPDRRERFKVLAGVMAEHTPEEPHWYLQMLATHPDWQRQGLGAQIMAPMFERAGEEGLPCYLETETVENVGYYRRFGFEVRSEWDVPTGGPHMWGMLRPVS